jgi:capsular exopolysaccharide synthesis family protein
MSTTTESFIHPGAAIVEAETYEPVSSEAVTLNQPRGAIAEQYRVLRHRLEMLARQGIKSLAFTSARSGEGKTTTVVNAALALGRGGRNRVVLVDADLRRPTVARMLGLRAREGLCDVVAGRAPLQSCLWRFGNDELYVLPAGNVPDDLSTTLYDPRLGETLAELRSRFDFVLADSPPVLPLADVPTLCRDLDGVVMVVRAGATPRELVGAAIDALFGVAVHGVVLNDVDPRAVTLMNLAPTGELPKALPAHR